MLNLVKEFNFILAADSYKADHYLEIPTGVQFATSVIVPRKPSKYAKKIVAAGQTLVAYILSTVRITHDMIDEAEIEIQEQGYTFNREGWERIVDEFDGKLPLEMFAVEEGRLIDPQTPLMSFRNTVAGFAWLVSYIETWAQCTVWKMSTVASTCRAARDLIRKYMEMTGSDMTMLNYKLHNFGDRGADSPEEAAVIAAIAHAFVFDGSDCMRANGYIKRLYRTKRAFTSSVEATEHSTMCMNSDAEAKDDFGAAKMAVARLHKVVERTKAGIGIPLMSVVIDTYDSRRFVRNYMGGVFKEEIINSGGKMVMRPDSGDPTVEPGLVANDLRDTFGLSGLTSTGHMVLHSAVGIIQGDGIRIETLEAVLKGFVDAGYSIDNLALGMGAGTTHEGGRDDFSFSQKLTAFSLDGKAWTRVLKEPKTDAGKKSLSGLVRCVEDVDGNLYVVDLTADPTQYAVSGPGWRLWVRNAEQLYFQPFEEVQRWARSL